VSLLDVLSGKVPLFRSTSQRNAINEIETDYARLINRQTSNNYRRKPFPSDGVIAEAIQKETNPQSFVSGRFTLNPNTRTKILDSGDDQWTIYITIPGPGQTAFATHSGIRAIQTSTAIHEGVPIINNPPGQTRPGPTQLLWTGELWLSGDTPGMVVDIEAG
jgi:hypothetical protein